MTQQLSLFLARQHANKKLAVRQAQANYERACRRHSGQGRAQVILQTCMTALLKFETKHGLTATPRAAKTARRAAA